MGLHTSSTVELAFDGYRLGPGTMMEAEGRGSGRLLTLDSGRIIIAAQACGIARAALGVAVAYAQERTAFGGPSPGCRASSSPWPRWPPSSTPPGC